MFSMFKGKTFMKRAFSPTGFHTEFWTIELTKDTFIFLYNKLLIRCSIHSAGYKSIAFAKHSIVKLSILFRESFIYQNMNHSTWMRKTFFVVALYNWWLFLHWIVSYHLSNSEPNTIWSKTLHYRLMTCRVNDFIYSVFPSINTPVGLCQQKFHYTNCQG